MLNFIVCEDDKIFQQEIKEEIEKFMMRSDVDYKIFLFSNYGKDFEDMAKKDIGFKMYFLDIKTKCGSGIDAIRYIREELDDWTSMIVIVTAFSEYRYEVLSNRLYLLDFINKLDDCRKKIKENLAIVLKNYNNKEKCLTFQYNYVVQKVEYRHILYIEKEMDSKHCIIHTTYEPFKIAKTISELEGILDNNFLKVHRSIIVNLNKIKKYDIRKNEITFDNNKKMNAISRDKKKELIEHVKNIN